MHQPTTAIHPTYREIYTLGPAGTFSDEAAQKVAGPDSKIIYTRTFSETLFKASQQPQAVAVVPIENSVAGIVDQVQDLLLTEDMIIWAEINLPVRYALIANVPMDQVKTHFAHPQANGQTASFAAHHLSESLVEFTHSNVESGVLFLQALEKDDPVAAVVPMSYAENHPEYVKAEDIQDYKNNTTRFLVVQKRNEAYAPDFSYQKTSIFVEFEEDRAGLLYELLSIFNQHNINLCRLESRPSKRIPWFYVFYVDFTNNKQTQMCLQALDQVSVKYTMLGSYSLIA